MINKKQVALNKRLRKSFLSEQTIKTPIKHTKGPWQVRKNDYYYLVESEGYLIAQNERKADALLIAAAPELLEALKLAYDNLRRDAPDSVLIPINKAIAKAEGNE